MSVQGLAGTGKTYTLRRLLKYADKAGYQGEGKAADAYVNDVVCGSFCAFIL